MILLLFPQLSPGQHFPSRICWIIASQTQQQLHRRRRLSSAAELTQLLQQSSAQRNKTLPSLSSYCV